MIVYHDVESRPPAWQIPEVDLSGWTPLIHRFFILRDHPQETTENSFDLGHFSYAHNYRKLRSLKEFESDGAYLSTRYAVTRALSPLDIKLAEYEVDFETQIYGLGYSMVSVQAPRFGVQARLGVLPTAWGNKRYTQPPALARGDGPIGENRQWARQFYS